MARRPHIRGVLHRIAVRRTRPELTEFERIQRRLALALLALLLVVAVGVVGFSIIGGGERSFIDAIYMTFVTLTTVGFGEIIDMSNNPAGRIFTMLLLLGGMGIVLYAVTQLAAFIVEGQLRHLFARRRTQRRIARMDGHYIICGDSPTAWYITEELVKTDRKVVLLAPTEEHIEQNRRALGDVLGVIGDPSDDDILLEAGLQQAAGIIFCMENEKDNLLGVLTARRLAPAVRIVAASERLETPGKLRTAGADAVVSPNRIGGLRIASEMVRPVVVTFLDQMLRAGASSLRVEEVGVPDEVEPGTTLDSLGVDTIPGTLLVAVWRRGVESFEFKPDPSTPVEAGMTIVVMTDATGRGILEKRLG
jgi:voltage-gated potassium channel